MRGSSSSSGTSAWTAFGLEIKASWTNVRATQTRTERFVDFTTTPCEAQAAKKRSGPTLHKHYFTWKVESRIKKRKLVYDRFDSFQKDGDRRLERLARVDRLFAV